MFFLLHSAWVSRIIASFKTMLIVFRGCNNFCPTSKQNKTKQNNLNAKGVNFVYTGT